MQVHKDTIDKVPNSLPNRGNIEIEIYGMEGIPPEDIKEHERHKGGMLYRVQNLTLRFRILSCSQSIISYK